MKTTLFLLVAVLLVIDYGQTRDIENHADLKEMNPILGEHPEAQAIRAYFVICLLAMAVAVLVLPDTIGMLLLGGLAVLEGVVTWRNWKLGLRVRLR